MPSIFPNDYRTVISALKRARKSKRVTQVELAEALRVKQSVISKIERGERRLDIVEIFRICEALDISLSTLLESLPPRLSPIPGKEEIAGSETTKRKD